MFFWKTELSLNPFQHKKFPTYIHIHIRIVKMYVCKKFFETCGVVIFKQMLRFLLSALLETCTGLYTFLVFQTVIDLNNRQFENSIISPIPSVIGIAIFSVFVLRNQTIREALFFSFSVSSFLTLFFSANNVSSRLPHFI